MEPVLQQLAASAIIAVFTGLGGLFLKRMKPKNDQANRARPLPVPLQPGPPQQAPYAAAAVPGWQPPAMAPAWQPPAASVSSGQVLIHIGLLQFAVNVVGFIIGFTVAALGATSGASEASINNTTIALVLLFGSLTAIVFFFFIGMRLERAIRWRHLSYVALGTALLTVVVNSLFLQTAISVAVIIFALIQTFVAMGIGGGLASLVGPKNRPLPVPPQQYAQPSMPLPPAPYGYGAPPNMPPQYPPTMPRPAAGAPPYGAPQYPPGPVVPGAPPPATPPSPYGPAAPQAPLYNPQYPPQGLAQAPGVYQPRAGQPPQAGAGNYPPPPYPPQTPPPAQPPYAPPPYPPANDQRGNEDGR
jgi:hypothetical protein